MGAHDLPSRPHSSREADRHMTGFARSARVAGAVARPGSHRTVRTLFVYGSSGRRVMNPAAGRFATSNHPHSASCGGSGATICWCASAVQVDQGHEPALPEERAVEAVVDRVRVAQRPPGLASRVDLPPRACRLDAQLDEVCVRLFVCVSSGAAGSRAAAAGCGRRACASSAAPDAEAIPKNPCHPRSHALIRAMHDTSVPPQFLGVSCRTRSIALRLVRSESSTSTIPVCGSNRSRKPRKWRSSGRATADLAWFTFRRRRPSMNSVRLAITRRPARSLRTYTLASSA